MGANEMAPLWIRRPNDYLASIALTLLAAACSLGPAPAGTARHASVGFAPLATAEPSLSATIPVQNLSTEMNGEAAASSDPRPAVTRATITQISAPAVLPAATATATPDLRPLPAAWRTWPVVPSLSPNLALIFQTGQALGNDPHAFSVIGDCQSALPVFMGIFSTDWYWLGAGYERLQGTIDYFNGSGSFERQSYSVQNGLSVASVLSPAWADPQVCEEGETPIDCEFRLHRPSIVFINLGTNWTANAAASHEAYLRQIVEVVIGYGAIPVLSTKGDNVEGDWGINQSIARVAYEYDLPLWNFWLATQDLPGRGLDPERPGGNYLTPAAWDRRSFTGLQVLDRIQTSLLEVIP